MVGEEIPLRQLGFFFSCPTEEGGCVVAAVVVVPVIQSLTGG